MKDDPLSDLRRHMNTYFGEGSPFNSGPRGGWRPLVDVYETPDAVIVVMDLAGVDPEHIEVNSEGRRLSVSGVRVPVIRQGAVRIHHLEIPHGRFHLAIELPQSVDPERSEATSRSGLLEIVLPLLEPVHPPISGKAAQSAGPGR
jgi:HSP20 family protein